jgi:hypothetical protein
VHQSARGARRPLPGRVISAPGKRINAPPPRILGQRLHPKSMAGPCRDPASWVAGWLVSEGQESGWDRVRVVHRANPRTKLHRLSSSSMDAPPNQICGEGFQNGRRLARSPLSASNPCRFDWGLLLPMRSLVPSGEAGPSPEQEALSGSPPRLSSNREVTSSQSYCGSTLPHGPDVKARQR